jgi:hypothetical protein
VALFCPWYTSQLDMKNAVLDDELYEVVCMQSPLWYSIQTRLRLLSSSLIVSIFILVF